MDKIQIIKKLEDFNKNAKDFLNLSFVKKSESAGFVIAWDNDKGLKTTWSGPNDEEIKAFVNDYRKFFQKNDTLKVHKLIDIYKSDSIEEAERNIFNKSMKEIEDINNGSTNYRINSKIIKNSEVLEVFLYGKYSHRTEGTRDVHDTWENILPAYIGLKFEFVMILYKCLAVIYDIVKTNEEVIRKLK
jgi:hypothetical protein